MITQNRKFNCMRGLSNIIECYWIAYSRAYFNATQVPFAMAPMNGLMVKPY